MHFFAPSFKKLKKNQNQKTMKKNSESFYGCSSYCACINSERYGILAVGGSLANGNS